MLFNGTRSYDGVICAWHKQSIIQVWDVQQHSPLNPAPRTNTSTLQNLAGVFSFERTNRNPRCWKKCLLKASLINLDDSAPVDIQDPPWGWSKVGGSKVGGSRGVDMRGVEGGGVVRVDDGEGRGLLWGKERAINEDCK